MKKVNLKYIALSFIAVAAFSLQSCSSDEGYDVVGNPNNLFYIKASSSASSPNTIVCQIIHTPVAELGTVRAQYPVLCTKPSSGDATVKAEIDNSLIDAYNTKYGTSYKQFPTGTLDVSKMSVTILKDSCKGQDSITISVSKDNLAKLTESGYIAPIRITSVDGANGLGSKDYGIAYLVVTTQTKLFKDNVKPSDMLGTLVTDYSGWTGSYPNGTSLNVADITNGQLDDNGWRLTTDSHTVIVDMKSVKNVTGIRSCRWYHYHADDDWREGYSFSSIALSLSQDGNTWTSVGTVDASKMEIDDSYYQYLGLYGAVKARYLKMECLSGSSSVSSLAELGVYVQ
ncbi:MAG: DUF1735 domain-containing protein [Bacteroidales bacterium]|nr:DUF1735 domain-containing protein [Bacteroidales bacterium]